MMFHTMVPMATSDNLAVGSHNKVCILEMPWKLSVTYTASQHSPLSASQVDNFYTAADMLGYPKVHQHINE